MLPEFMLRAGLAALGTALAAGPLGCFVVWRRMAYFGDATAHAALLGVALALAVELPIFAGTLMIALLMGLAVSRLTRAGAAADMVLGVASHSALAAGLVAVTLLDGPRVDLSAFLFGDVLAVSVSDVLLVWGGAAVVVGLLVWRWQSMLLATVSPDLAHASGINPRREEDILMLVLAIVVAVAIKLVGALLIGALLIIPAAAARNWARTPEHMAVTAAGLGAVSALAGLAASWVWNTDAGPSIVCAAAVIFVLSLPARLIRG